jgi:hypothetical protein
MLEILLLATLAGAAALLPVSSEIWIAAIAGFAPLRAVTSVARRRMIVQVVQSAVWNAAIAIIGIMAVIALTMRLG